MFGKEFRQPELSLEKAELSDGASVFTQRGQPLRLGGALHLARAHAFLRSHFFFLLAEIHCSFWSYDFQKGTFAPLFDMPVDESILLADLKKMLGGKTGNDPKFMRIRGAERRFSFPLVEFCFRMQRRCSRSQAKCCC